MTDEERDIVVKSQAEEINRLKSKEIKDPYNTEPYIRLHQQCNDMVVEIDKLHDENKALKRVIEELRTVLYSSEVTT
jgi:SepF-like predicted cell division protein (DUF552 family)